MKKVTFFALLVLASMIFVAPALKAQEAPAAEDAQVQEAQAPAPEAPAADAEDEEAAKKAKAITVLDDDDQTGNFFSTVDIEGLGAFFGVDFDTNNPVITTSHTIKDDDEGDEPGPIPPLSRGARY
jgi:nucleoid-associated protein YgaU